jgi:hypothetical protein
MSFLIRRDGRLVLGGSELVQVKAAEVHYEA